MRMFIIKNTAMFMTGLLSEKEAVFDRFLLNEAVIMMGNTYTVDGHINKDFYTEEEIEILKQQSADNGLIFSEEMIRWGSVRNFCYECIRGKKTPLAFRIVFCLSPENTARFLSGLDTSVSPEQIGSLNVNIKYDGSTLSCTTAVSLKIFTMDKTLEHAWDEMFSRFLNVHGYEYE